MHPPEGWTCNYCFPISQNLLPASLLLMPGVSLGLPLLCRCPLQQALHVTLLPPPQLPSSHLLSDY
jgi:hypothetical protein